MTTSPARRYRNGLPIWSCGCVENPKGVHRHGCPDSEMYFEDGEWKARLRVTQPPVGGLGDAEQVMTPAEHYAEAGRLLQQWAELHRRATPAYRHELLLAARVHAALASVPAAAAPDEDRCPDCGGDHDRIHPEVTPCPAHPLSGADRGWSA